MLALALLAAPLAAVPLAVGPHPVHLDFWPAVGRRRNAGAHGAGPVHRPALHCLAVVGGHAGLAGAAWALRLSLAGQVTFFTGLCAGWPGRTRVGPGASQQRWRLTFSTISGHSRTGAISPMKALLKYWRIWMQNSKTVASRIVGTRMVGRFVRGDGIFLRNTRISNTSFIFSKNKLGIEPCIYRSLFSD